MRGRAPSPTMPSDAPNPDPDLAPVPAPARRDPLAALARTSTVEARCAAVTRSIAEGRSSHFKLDAAALDALRPLLADDAPTDHADAVPPAGGVAARGNRWTALQVGGVDRVASLRAALDGRTAAERWLAEVDLVALLALLDSEAAVGWSFEERTDAVDALALPGVRHESADLFAMLDRFTPGAAGTGAVSAATAAPPAGPQTASAASAARVEPRRWRGTAGLAVATCAAFRAGVFSSSRSDPLRADAAALAQIDAAALRAAFQVGPANSLPGLDARAAALAAIGRRLMEKVGRGRPARLSNGLWPWAAPVPGAAADAEAGAPRAPVTPDAEALLIAAARAFNPAFAQGPMVLGLRVGDAAAHPWAGMAAPLQEAAGHQDRGTAGWVPFHLGLQSMVRSLLEPWQTAVSGPDGTAPPPGADAPRVPTFAGLDRLCDWSAERHVAWLIDRGVLVPRSQRDLARLLPLADGVVVEARAAAVHLLGGLVRQEAARLASVGQAGGEWTEDRPRTRGLGTDRAAAMARDRLDALLQSRGRSLAHERRGGSPVLMVQPDSGLW
jgi:hypothetical protein